MSEANVVTLARYRKRVDTSDPLCTVSVTADMPVSVAATLVDFLQRKGCEWLADYILETSTVHEG
jgi:hypothetical protein